MGKIDRFWGNIPKDFPQVSPIPMSAKKKKYPVRGLELHGRKWRWVKTIRGRKTVHVIGECSEAEAIAWVMEMEKRPELVEAGRWEFEVKRYIAEEVAEGKVSGNYAENRQDRLLGEGLAMGFVSPKDMTPARLQAWYDDGMAGRWVKRGKQGQKILDDDGKGMLRPVKPGTVNHYLKHFRCFGNWLVENQILLENPVLKVKSLDDHDSKRHVFLEASEVSELLAFAREDWDGKEDGYPMLELFVLLCCECGMRRGEADAARAEWVDMDRGLIVIPKEDEVDGQVWRRKGRGKNRRGVAVPMVEGLREWFEKYGIPSPYLLKPKILWGEYIYRYNIATKYRRFMADFGRPDVTIHDLRRSFGSNRVSAGVSMAKVANWMGIALRTAEQRYARFIPADDEIEKGSAKGAVGRESSVSARERLQELKGLLDDGLISVEDFELKKAGILSTL